MNVTQREHHLEKKLLAAVTANDLQAVKNVIAEGVNLTYSHLKVTLNEIIIVSIQNNAKDIIAFLIEHGLEERHFLAQAAYLGDLDMVRYFIESETDTKIETLEQREALHWAARYGHMPIVQYLIEERKIDINGDKQSPHLCWAAQMNQLAVVRYLLKKGADIHLKQNYAVRMAARNGHVDIVRFLHQHGANIHADNNDAFFWATRNNREAVLRYLIENNKNIHEDNLLQKLLYEAIQNNASPSLVSYLIEMGADIKAEDHKALTIAAGSNRWELICLLIEKGADLKHYILQNVLHQACCEGNLNQVMYLNKQGVDISSDQALQFAFQLQKWPIVHYLIKNGAPYQKIKELGHKQTGGHFKNVFTLGFIQDNLVAAQYLWGLVPSEQKEKYKLDQYYNNLVFIALTRRKNKKTRRLAQNRLIYEYTT